MCTVVDEIAKRYLYKDITMSYIRNIEADEDEVMELSIRMTAKDYDDLGNLLYKAGKLLGDPYQTLALFILDELLKRDYFVSVQ